MSEKYNVATVKKTCNPALHKYGHLWLKSSKQFWEDYLLGMEAFHETSCGSQKGCKESFFFFYIWYMLVWVRG